MPLDVALKPDLLSADELDKQLSIAVATGDKPSIHALAEERLSRDEFISGFSRRKAMLLQTLDLDLIREHETWRLGDYPSFYAYLNERRLEYEGQGYDSEADILVVKGYSTVLAWSNIVAHFHRRHNIPIELLSYVPKGKLETVSGVCNRWDAAHDDQMDQDLHELLFTATVTKDDILPLYAKRKKLQGIAVPVDDTGGKIEPKAEDEDRELDGGGETDGSDESDPPEQRELDITMDTETGELTAWLRRGKGHVPMVFGRLYVKSGDKYDMIINLCETWRVRLT